MTKATTIDRKRQFLFVLLLVAVLTALSATAAHSVPIRQQGSGVTSKQLEKDGYACSNAGVDGLRCEKGSSVYYCNEDGSNCQCVRTTTSTGITYTPTTSLTVALYP